MLSTDQIDHFRTFGFVAFPGLLGSERAEILRAEVDTAIKDAFAATYDERVSDGISGHYLPMASRLTPTSTALVCDDRRLIEAAEDLLRGPVIPECPVGVLYFAEAGWHNDDGIGRARGEVRHLLRPSRCRQRRLASGPGITPPRAARPPRRISPRPGCRLAPTQRPPPTRPLSLATWPTPRPAT